MIETLQRRALVGVQGSAMAVEPVGDAVIDDCLQSATATAGTPAQALLRQAALLTVATRCQQRPAQPVIDSALPLAADNRPPLPEAGANLLQRVANDEDDALLTPLLDLSVRGGWRLPEPVLVTLLLGARSREQRDRVRALCSPRIAWLAALNPDWAWAGDTVDMAPELAFDIVTGEARVQTLQRWREIDASAARAAVQAGWGECAPDERAALLKVFAHGLDMGDEPFLELALDDRRKEVRQVAQDLLARLPESQLVQRCCSRVLPLLTVTAMPRPQLDIALPAAHDKPMLRDGIEAKPPTGRGERQHWLLQLLESTPPARLAAHLGLDAASLLRLIVTHSDRRDLLRAIARAASRQRDLAFIDVWFSLLGEHKAFALPFFEQLAVDALQHDGEARLRVLLTDRDTHQVIWPRLPSMLADLPGPWSAEFSTVLLDCIEAGMQTSDWSSRWTCAQCLLTASLMLDPLHTPLDRWRQSPAAEPLSQRERNRFEQRLDIRHQFATLTRSR